jgi:hypothetical protein
MLLAMEIDQFRLLQLVCQSLWPYPAVPMGYWQLTVDLRRDHRRLSGAERFLGFLTQCL